MYNKYIYNNFMLTRFMYNKIVFREYKNEKCIFYDNVQKKH